MPGRSDICLLLWEGPEVGYTVTVPLLPGCVTYGEMIDDAIAMAKEAIEIYIEDLRQSLVRERVKVAFPKFTLDAGYSLPETLAVMGMPTVFSMDAGLSGMDGSDMFFVSVVVHKAFVDVNEEGTEAAAATGVPLEATSLRPDTTPVFRADHPFVFLITEKDSGRVLFIGRIVNPESR